MGIFAMRFLLLFKTKLKSTYTYLWIVLIAVSLLLVKYSLIPTEKPSEVLILNESGEYGERVFKILKDMNTQGAYIYTEAEDEASLRNAVRTGSAMCGFIITENIKERGLEEDTSGMIIMVTSPFSVNAAAVRETVFAALFRVINLDIVESREDILFEDPDLVREYIRDRYSYYINSNDVFRLEYEAVETDVSDPASFFTDSSEPLRGTAAVLIFILSLYMGGRAFGKTGSFFRSLRRIERRVCFFLYEMTCVMIPAFAAFIMIRVLDGGKVSFARDLIAFAVFLIFSCVWSGVYVSFFKKSATYYPSVSVMLFVSLVLCPVFVDIGRYIPVIGMVTRILPPSLYLHMLF